VKPQLGLKYWAAPLAGVAIVASASTVRSDPGAPARAVKVLVVAATDAEAQPWIDSLAMTDSVPVTGLRAGDPAVHCNSDDVCEVTTGIGKANAVASVSAVVFGGPFDLSKTYFVVAGLAAIDPSQGTVGSAAWAGYVVDSALAWEIDARSLPAGWTTGYLGIDTTSPTEKPNLQYGTEVYPIAAPLLQAAVALSKTATLEDDDGAKANRALYSGGPATQPPAVVQCDATVADTVWRGALLGTRARDWTSLLTDGKGSYCVSAREDSAAITALQRGGSAGLLDATRVLVLHAAATFDRPHAGQAPYELFVDPSAGGFPSATKNLAIAGEPFVKDVVARWSQWQAGVPQ
jgi:purine nucleoside permease